MNALREALPTGLEAVQPCPPGLWPELHTPMQSVVTRLMHHAQNHPLRQLMVVGAAPGVGNSLVASQTAEHLSRMGWPTVLRIEVDGHAGDPRGGAAAPLASPWPTQGAPRPPVSLLRLSGQQCVDLFTPAKRSDAQGLPHAWLQDFDLVVWDVPSPSVSPAALRLASAVDGIVLTLQAHRTRRQVAAHVAQSLAQAGGTLLGVVLNRTHRFIPDWLYRWL